MALRGERTEPAADGVAAYTAPGRASRAVPSRPDGGPIYNLPATGAPATGIADGGAPTQGLESERLVARLGLRTAPAPLAHLEASLLGPARRFLARRGRRVRAELVEAAWRIGGGRGTPPPALGQLVETLHAGSLIVDDVQDGSTHRRAAPALHREVGAPLALNTGNFLYFWPFELLRGIGLEPARELACTRRLADAFLRCHAGQALDLGVAVDALAREEVRPLVSAATELKTGGLVAFALALGATAAGAREPVVDALDACGGALGVGLQMLDDLGNLVAAPEKRGEDLRLGRATWVWAWAAEDRDGYDALRAQGRAVRAGALPADALAAALRTRVEAGGRADAHACLAGALAGLDAAGLPAAAEALAPVAARLEAQRGSTHRVRGQAAGGEAQPGSAR